MAVRRVSGDPQAMRGVPRSGVWSEGGVSPQSGGHSGERNRSARGQGRGGAGGMCLLVVGSRAFDSIRSPFGEVEKVVGGSATYFSLAASYLAPVRLVSVVGADFPPDEIRVLGSRASAPR